MVFWQLSARGGQLSCRDGQPTAAGARLRREADSLHRYDDRLGSRTAKTYRKFGQHRHSGRSWSVPIGGLYQLVVCTNWWSVPIVSLFSASLGWCGVKMVGLSGDHALTQTWISMPVQLALFPESVALTRVRPERDECRFYRLEIRPDLFGRTLLIRRWGRIGTPGRQRRDPHPDAGSALNALAKLARAKRRCGYCDA
jgi:predicted DNA-binding WGR domain protein